jgi:predicted nuclease of predicted toxin-antitoxin system
LAAALARWLSEHGHEAEHVADRNMDAASDTVIWDHALATGAVIITKDENFAQRRLLAKSAPRFVWIRLPNTRRRSLLAWFKTALPQIVSALERGETLVEMIMEDGAPSDESLRQQSIMAQ